MFSKPLLITTGVLFLLLSGSSWALYKQIQRNGALEQEAEQAWATLEGAIVSWNEYAREIEAEAELNERIAVEARRRARQLDREHERAQQQLREAERNDEALAQCLDMPMPDDYVRGLRGDAENPGRETDD